METETVAAKAGSLVDAPGVSYDPAANRPEPSPDLGKDEFLQLLVAQLKYQDPLNPSSSDEFIATTAQFTVVEKLDELTRQGENSALVNSLTTASSLIGREVTANINGVNITAVVDESQIVSGKVQLLTELGAIGLDQIVSVAAPPMPEPVVPVVPPVQAPVTETAAATDEASGESAETEAIEPVEDSEAVVDAPDEVVADEPVVDEPVVDEPVVDEPVLDEPAVNEPVVVEPAAVATTTTDPSIAASSAGAQGEIPPATELAEPPVEADWESIESVDNPVEPPPSADESDEVEDSPQETTQAAADEGPFDPFEQLS